MMSAALFKKEAAERINCLAQAKIAPHLFVFCNFSPDTMTAQSADGCLMLGILNMFKLVYDASIVDNMQKWLHSNHIGTQAARLDKLILTAKAWRSYLAHNQSSPAIQEKSGAKMDLWLKGHGVSQLISAGDYQQCLRLWENMADELMKSLEIAIGELSQGNREEVVASWENWIRTFYQRPSSGNIVKHYLLAAYETYDLQGRHISPHSEYRICKEYAERLFFAKINARIKEKRDIIRSYKIATLQDKAREALDNLEREKNELRQTIEPKYNDYCKAYLMERFDECLQKPRQNMQAGELLPQFFLQRAVDEDMASM